MLQASFKLRTAVWDLYCKSLNNQYLHTTAHAQTYPGTDFSYRKRSDQADTLEWLLVPD